MAVQEARRHLPSAAEYLRERTDEPTAASWPGAIARLLGDVGGWLKSGSVFDYNQLAALTAQLWETVNRLRPYVYVLPLPGTLSGSRSVKRDHVKTDQSGNQVEPTAVPASATKRTRGKRNEVSWKAQAIGLLCEHRDLTISELARLLDKHPATIYRAAEKDEVLAQLIRARADVGRIPAGHRDTKSGNIEAEATAAGYDEVDRRMDLEDRVAKLESPAAQPLRATSGAIRKK